MGAISPFGQVLMAHLTTEQFSLRHDALLGQHLPGGVGARDPSVQNADLQRTRSQFRLRLAGIRLKNVNRRMG